MTPNPPTIDSVAAEWAVRLSADPLSVEEQQALDEWLNADTRHRGALIRARAAWVDLDRLAALSAHPSASAPTVAASSALSAACEARRLESPPVASSSRRFFLAAGLAAISLTGTGVAAWWFRRRGDIYETAVGEIRRIPLSDGSAILLDTDTRAEVRFAKADRTVELVRGQGLFEVAKDAVRPFIVLARGISVRAVGTVFAVRAVDQDVKVTVTEGVVEVADPGTSGSAALERVGADERAVVSASQGIRVQRVSAAQIDRNLAWRDGMLSFDGDTLSDAVKEINRHNTRQILIDDPTLAGRPVVGVFRATNAEGFAETVAAALGAESAVEGDTLHLRARNAR